MVLLSPRLGGGAPHTPSVVYSAEHEHDGSKNKIIKGGVGSARLLVPCWPRFAMGQPSGAPRVVYSRHEAVLETARGGEEGAAPSHPQTAANTRPGRRRGGITATCQGHDEQHQGSAAPRLPAPLHLAAPRCASPRLNRDSGRAGASAPAT